MRALVAGLLLLLAAQAPPITNADVIRMIAAKLGDTVIVTARPGMRPATRCL